MRGGVGAAARVALPVPELLKERRVVAQWLAAVVVGLAQASLLGVLAQGAGDEGAKAIADAVAASGSLALRKLVVPNGLERHAELMAACESKGVELARL